MVTQGGRQQHYGQRAFTIAKEQMQGLCPTITTTISKAFTNGDVLSGIHSRYIIKKFLASKARQATPTR